MSKRNIAFLISIIFRQIEWTSYRNKPPYKRKWKDTRNEQSYLNITIEADDCKQNATEISESTPISVETTEETTEEATKVTTGVKRTSYVPSIEQGNKNI